jgi:flagellar biosynthesis protein FlhF
MNVKRYFGKTAREALRTLKAELGPDAIVLSNRAVQDGVEILALPAEAVGAIEASAQSAPRSAAGPGDLRSHAAPDGPAVEQEDSDYRVSLSTRSPVQETARQVTPSRPAPPLVKPFSPPRMETPDYLIRKRGYQDQAPGPELACDLSPHLPRDPVVHMPSKDFAGLASEGRAASEQARHNRRAEDERIRALQEANANLMNELSGIRGMIERQLAGFAWSETRRNAPARAEIVGELLEAGFSGSLARQLAETVSEGATVQAARETVRAALARDLRAMSSDADLIDQGGVYALVGPTGVGKTTTTAKIAARCVVRHGAEKLALITTDGYRIGAQEQLRIYGRILGVPVFPVRDASDLRQTLAELSGKHMVLIDTVGMSQRDRMVAQQAAMLAGAGRVRRLLLLNATCRGDTLDDVIQAYRGPDLAGCILTKVDEAASLAPAIGAAITTELEVLYVTNGQRVPEDLHLPNRAYLLHRAMRAQSEDSPWKLQGDEAAFMMAASGTER